MVNRFNFRLWDKEDNKFIKDFLIDSEGELFVFYCRGAVDRIDNKDNRYIIMQSTGLVDKNKNPIFIGDFLKTPEGIYHVRDIQLSVKFAFKNIQSLSVEEFCADHGTALLGYLKDVEVIGNIYEDKYLIKEVYREK